MTQEYWKDKISKWESCGKSMAEFCRHEDLSYWTFRQWRKRLTNKPESNLIKLDPIKLQPNEAESQPLKINLKGVSIVIPHHYNEKQLLRVISSLRKLP